jgi:hypothetical protein
LLVQHSGHDYSVLLGAHDLLHNKRITFVIFEVWSNHFVKLVAQHMAHYGDQCFLLTRDTLVPVHETDWWYVHMDSFKRQWWGNGLCGIKGSNDMKMLWRMYHSDNVKLLNSEAMVSKTEPFAEQIYTRDEMHAFFTKLVEQGVSSYYSCCTSYACIFFINLIHFHSRRSTME